MITPQPLSTKTLAWFMSKLGITYSIVRVPNTWQVLYRIQTSKPIKHTREGLPGMHTYFAPSYSNASQCELTMCSDLGWFFYDPGVNYGKLCEVSTGIFPWETKRVDLRWTKLIP